MPSMSTAATASRSRPSVAVWVLLGVVALGAVATVAVMVWAVGYGEESPADLSEALLALFTVVVGVLFVVWALVPFVAMAATVFFADRRAGGGRGVVVVLGVGVAALVVLTGAALGDFVTSESSTAALIFIFLPLYQLVVVLATAGVAFGVHALVGRHRRHRRRRLPPGASRAQGAS